MSGRCPICGAPTVPRYRPFCSKRCADVDLHRWLSGSYALPAETPMDGLEGDGGLAGGTADAPPRGFEAG